MPPVFFLTVKEGADGPTIFATCDEKLVRQFGALIAQRLGVPLTSPARGRPGIVPLPRLRPDDGDEGER